MLMAALVQQHPVSAFGHADHAAGIGGRSARALLIAGQPLSLIAAIGFVMLNGIATKNAILMVDYTNTLCASEDTRGMDALREAAPDPICVRS